VYIETREKQGKTNVKVEIKAKVEAIKKEEAI
jgi:hypothetical protein